MSILKELNELAAKYSEDYEKETTIEGAIDAVDKSLESAFDDVVESFKEGIYGEGGTPADPAEGSIAGDIAGLQDATEDLHDAIYGEGGTPAEPAAGSILYRIAALEGSAEPINDPTNL